MALRSIGFFATVGLLMSCEALQPPDGGMPDAGLDADGGISCSQWSAQQCSCSASAPEPNATACGAAQVGGAALCCATAGWPAAGASACFCESWGCSGTVCGLGLGPATAAAAPDGGVCCASNAAPGCTCSAAGSCAADKTRVTRCELATAVCGAQYPYPTTVASCR